MGRKAVALQVDSKNPDEIKRLVDVAIGEFWRIDILVNSAGKFDDFHNYTNMTNDLWNAVKEINVNGTFFFYKYITDYMVKQGKGVVVTIASAAGVMSNGGGPAYTTSKLAVVGMMKNLTSELGLNGIGANTICLGLVATPMVADLMSNPEFMSSVNGTPAGRIAQVNDLSKLIKFLASDDLEYIHGDAILIDGGLVAGGGFNP